MRYSLSACCVDIYIYIYITRMLLIKGEFDSNESKWVVFLILPIDDVFLLYVFVWSTTLGAQIKLWRLRSEVDMTLIATRCAWFSTLRAWFSVTRTFWLWFSFWFYHFDLLLLIVFFYYLRAREFYIAIPSIKRLEVPGVWSNRKQNRSIIITNNTYLFTKIIQLKWVLVRRH